MSTAVESLELNELTPKAGSSQRISVLLSEVKENTATIEAFNQIEENRNGVAADVTRLESSLGRVDGGFQAWSLVRVLLSIRMQC